MSCLICNELVKLAIEIPIPALENEDGSVGVVLVCDDCEAERYEANLDLLSLL